MVSIPDWAKFSRLVEGQKTSSMTILNKYHKYQELEAIKQAEETGYFLEPSTQYLLQNMGPLSGTLKDIHRIFLVHLNGLHLRKLGDIPLCVSLQICILPNNFLTRIDYLSSCQQLIKLDLHGNQLTSIPGPSFWSVLRKLRALHLHDNPLGRFETLQNLSAAPSLTILTLYDTPLFLKKNYRHHVVNSIWTLKALDYHVISDEEIIEDAVFGGHFAALNPALRLDLCPSSPQDTTYWQEAKRFQQLESKIITALARHSPVIIIQRYVRGYFARKGLGLVQAHKRAFHSSQTHGVLKMPAAVTQQAVSGTMSTLPPVRRTDDSETGLVPPPSPSLFGPVCSETDSISGGQKRNIYINLAKLQSGTLQTLQDEADTVENDYRTTTSSTKLDARKRKLPSKKEQKAQRIKSVKQFFGPVVKPQSGDDQLEAEEEEDQPVTHYRLRGHRPMLILSDPTTEMVLSRMVDGRHVREAEAERIEKCHQQLPPKVVPYSFTTNDQRLFARVHGTMGLSCVMAVQKAYKEREKAECTTAKMEYIMAMKEERQRAKERISMYQDEKRNQVMRKRDQDRARLLDQLEKKELLRLNYLDRQQEVKGRASQLAKTLQADTTFMTEFSSQHTSVSKALMRHDRQAKYEEKTTSKKEKVSSRRTVEVEQQETVKKYLEHRQLMRQTETAMARAALDTRMLQETTERLMEARQRVAHKKAKEATVQAFYPLPPSNVPPAIATAPAGLSRWEADVMSQHGRVGRHNTVYSIT